MINASNFILSSLDDFISGTHLIYKSPTRFHIVETIFRFGCFHQVLGTNFNILKLGCRINDYRGKWGNNFLLSLLLEQLDCCRLIKRRSQALLKLLHLYFYRCNFFFFFLNHLTDILMLLANRIQFQSFAYF